MIGKTFQSFKTGRTYFMKFDFQCTSSNVVYLISCKRCHLQYVGSTRTEFKVRFRNHKSAMRTNKKTCEVAFHYNSSPHVMQLLTRLTGLRGTAGFGGGAGFGGILEILEPV